jgi:hypothetical protein
MGDLTNAEWDRIRHPGEDAGGMGYPGGPDARPFERCRRCGEAFTDQSERAEVRHWPTRAEQLSWGGQAVLMDDVPDDIWAPHLVVHQSCMIDGDEVA